MLYKDKRRIVNLKMMKLKTKISNLVNVRMMKLKIGKVRIVKLKNWNGEIIIYCRV